ncbi:MAG: cyclic pyranopterin monophosphate synthase MoaC [Acetomicrobium flavidum]|uniref:Cyclic pyranopterin monophosphate synthase n=1 Tax=Acetomicrobium flavidum TaxID=49896 RepID=A0ABY1JAX6_9BACT|nr:cyclic pyranopterin monophosphate synthase MoaC [Acetomicrobium flavidum]SIN62800.1 cyclic pyranopterin monophosphate synthase subunit MoaC [Acetomicrobium flavidum]HPP14030.1 cyclic pyranopterin monophosphate synthase MoaC [Acetomicrobium flavidum]
MGSITHLDEYGHPKMVDVGAKDPTERMAKACGWIILPRSVYDVVCRGEAPKGDVLKIAELAGIMAAKRTWELIPLCHNIRIDHVEVRCELDEKRSGIRVTSDVSAREVTGVEMEALTAVTVALLTIYDMCKGIDKGMYFEDIHLAEKSGGKSGHYVWKGQEVRKGD